MNYTIIKKLPSAEEIIQLFPLSEKSLTQIQRDREEIKHILAGHDPRLLIIVGPCSAWPKEAVFEYAQRLVVLNEEVKHALKLVMRVYIQKPRTTKGWLGPVNQPDPFAPADIEAGIKYTREMMIRVIDLGLPIADEALFTHNAKGFLELLSWVAIGARSAEDQEHRIFASAIDCAVGLKNPTHGSLAIGVNSVIAAQYPHVAAFDGYEIQTHGNPYAHLVLRGSNHAPNYALHHLEKVKQVMDKQHIINPAVMVDVSHDNCMVNGTKDYRQQMNIPLQIMQDIEKLPSLKNLVKGFMIESFLQEGQQRMEDLDANTVNLNGLSITDPCLSFEQTAIMLRELAQRTLV